MLREFIADLRAQKLRTALTVLGITWGTVATSYSEIAVMASTRHVRCRSPRWNSHLTIGVLPVIVFMT